MVQFNYIYISIFIMKKLLMWCSLGLHFFAYDVHDVINTVCFGLWRDGIFDLIK